MRLSSIALLALLPLLSTCVPNGGGIEDSKLAVAEPTLYPYTRPSSPEPCNGPLRIDGRISGWNDELSHAFCVEEICDSDDVCVTYKCQEPDFYKPGTHEWSCAQPIKGTYGVLYVTARQGRLHILHDWLLRADQEICPEMYNLFRLSTGFGAPQWVIRVYGDGKATVTLNGEPYPLVDSAYAYRSSPNMKTPHTIFEFALGSWVSALPGQQVAPGPWTMGAWDPKSAAQIAPTGPAVSSTLAGDAVAGCADPKGALVREPTISGGVLWQDGTIDVGVSYGARLVTLEPVAAQPGAIVTMYTSDLEQAQTTVMVDDEPVEIAEWSPGRVCFIVPDGDGTKHVWALVDGKKSNKLTLKVATPGG